MPRLLNAPEHCGACGAELRDDTTDQCGSCGRIYCGECCSQPVLFTPSTDPLQCGAREQEVRCAGCHEVVDAHTAQLERCAQCRVRYCRYCVDIDHLLVEYANDEGESLCRRCNSGV